MRKLTWFGVLLIVWLTQALAGIAMWLTAMACDVPLAFGDALGLALPAVIAAALVWLVVLRVADR